MPQERTQNMDNAPNAEMSSPNGPSHTNRPNFKFIESENSGGGNWIDFIHLLNGTVLVLSDEYVGQYASKEAFYEAQDQLGGFYLKPRS